MSNINNNLLKEVGEYDLTRLNRIEIIDQHGRAYVNTDVENVEFAFQDGNETLKIFLKDLSPDTKKMT